MGIAVQNMNRFRLPLFLALGLVIGLPVGWCLRGRTVAAKEALLHNLVEIEKARQQRETQTNASPSNDARPETTPFDYSPILSAIYLQAFDEGYDNGLRGVTSMEEYLGLPPAPPDEAARLKGIRAGEIAGGEARRANKTHKRN